MKTWHAFAFLIITAVALYYAKTPLLILAAIVGIFRALRWLEVRYPRTTYYVLAFLSSFIRGLLGRR